MSESDDSRSQRPGGRSSRVQASVHRAVEVLIARLGRDALTVPMIAAEAGVTPSTIYRRWGDLPTLLADVAVRALRPDAPPAETGTLEGDLLAWVEAWQEEICSDPGREMIRDIVACIDGSRPACRFADVTRGQLAEILGREAARGRPVPDADAAMEAIVGPVLFRLIFDRVALTPDFGARRVRGFLGIGDGAAAHGSAPRAVAG